jgi:hypothetical protein
MSDTKPNILYTMGGRAITDDINCLMWAVK